VFWIPADGGGKPRLLIHASNTPFPESFSPDGRWLAFSVSNPVSGDLDIWIAPLTGQGDTLQVGKPEPFIQTPGNDRNATFSPDGRWLAYDSSESGIYEVYVRPFSEQSGRPSAIKWQVSNGGGYNGRWSPNGHELFYSINNRIMVVTFATHDDRFVADTPRVWSEREMFTGAVMPTFDVTPDGERLAVEVPTPSANNQSTGHHVTLVLNFFDDLRRIAPLSR
jgi:serine/threonine-protein kinase